MSTTDQSTEAAANDTPALAESAEAASALAGAAATAPQGGSPRDYFRQYLQRIRGGEMGSLPAITGLVLLVIFFRIVHPTFGGLFNFGNMLTEGAGPVLIAMGLVFVLLLGEIDLSAGYAAGVCAMVMVRLMVGYNVPVVVSVGAALLTGVVIGLLIGLLRAKIRIPSFVVTLAFFLAFQGVALYIANNGKGQTGDIRITDNFVNGLEHDQLPVWGGWLFGAICVALYAVIKLLTQNSRRRGGLPTEPPLIIALKIGALTVGVFLAVFGLNQNRAINKTPIPQNINGKIQFVKPPALEGIPWVVPLIVALFVIWTLMLSRTRYGRHIYAVGGNEEASRRAGIAVDRVRASVFVLCSFMAAIGGIIIGSNVKSVSVSNYGGNTLLLAVGAAVIGGTSLFGGKGRMIDAIIGGAVVEVIYNGMSDLVKGTNSSSVQYVVTGLVLLLAAAVDALSRRRAGATGLA